MTFPNQVPPYSQSNVSIATMTRVTYISNWISFPIRIPQVRCAFALNTQRLLQVRFLVVDVSNVQNNFYCPGISLLSFFGGSDYIVGDGQEGEIIVSVDQDFPAGKRLAIEAYNADALNAHTLDARIDILPLI